MILRAEEMECLFSEFVSKMMCGNLYRGVHSEKSQAVLDNWGFFPRQLGATAVFVVDLPGVFNGDVVQ